jgi:hypothetical protein
MKRFTSTIVGFMVAVFLMAAGFSVYAQVARPYRNGSVWAMSLIRVSRGWTLRT